MPLRLERPVTWPPQPPLTSVMYDLPTGNVAAAKKSSPLGPHRLVGQLVVRGGQVLAGGGDAGHRLPAAMTIRPSSTLTSPGGRSRSSSSRRASCRRRGLVLAGCPPAGPSGPGRPPGRGHRDREQPGAGRRQRERPPDGPGRHPPGAMIGSVHRHRGSSSAGVGALVPAEDTTDRPATPLPEDRRATGSQPPAAGPLRLHRRLRRPLRIDPEHRVRPVEARRRPARRTSTRPSHSRSGRSRSRSDDVEGGRGRGAQGEQGAGHARPYPGSSSPARRPCTATAGRRR